MLCIDGYFFAITGISGEVGRMSLILSVLPLSGKTTALPICLYQYLVLKSSSFLGHTTHTSCDEDYCNGGIRARIVAVGLGGMMGLKIILISRFDITG
jgi:hypothetical protein